ncbi:MAG: precorrin-3B C(17)-methyltransferase [Thermoleophilia bacterium]
MNRERTDHISYFSLTAGGALLALRLRDRFGGDAHLPRCHSMGCGNCSPFDSLSEVLPERFLAGDTIICVMAAGIVFRLLAPHLDRKQTDPAVIVINEAGRHVIPLLGGHAAGANKLARELATFLGGEAAITTASDVQGLTAPDEVAAQLHARVADSLALRRVTALLVDGRRVCIESPCDPGIAGYDWVAPGGPLDDYAGRLLVTYLSQSPDGSGDVFPTARLIPPMITAGVGCKRGASAAQIIAAIDQVCRDAGVDPLAVGGLASIDIKADEVGLRAAAASLGATIKFFPADRLAAMGCPGSDFVAGTTGTPAVAEPAALLAAGEGARLLAGKTVCGPVTVALALREVATAAATVATPDQFLEAEAGQPRTGAAQSDVAFPDQPDSDAMTESDAPALSPGRVLVIGTGAGTADLLTAQAVAAINDADVVLGYHTYIEQLRPIFPDKDYSSGSMGRELDRCREAVELAATGKTVAMVSSGDPGIYGMAGPILEIAEGVEVDVIPGITAAQIAASRLGAPLMNDFVTLSLSDLLTPRVEVLRRVTAAAASDLVTCLYNPTSRKRQPLYEEACAILLKHRPADTPVGWVRDAGGPAEEVRIVALADLAAQDTDMRTVIIVGNSRTEVIGERLVTRRGYREGE